MHIHIATLGERTEPIIKGFRTIPGIEKAYILYSNKYRSSADVIEEFLNKGGTPSVFIPVNEYDFQEVMDNISRLYESESEGGRTNTYSINVTGGTKPMAFAAYSSAYFIGATVYYIQLNEDLPLEQQLLTLLTTKAPKNSKSDKKGRLILKFIYEQTIDVKKHITNSDIETKFDLSKQQVSYYVKNLLSDGLIVVDRGLPDDNGNKNCRQNDIRLTQQGQMEAKFIRNL